MTPADQSAIREKVERFEAFTADNDPYHEHDFESLEHAGERIFWRIDYYNRTLTQGSEDPSDPSQTARVLTIMLASAYLTDAARPKLRRHDSSSGAQFAVRKTFCVL